MAGGAAFLAGGWRPDVAAAAVGNPIAVENQAAGSTSFQLGAGQWNGEISGYATQASVQRGEPLDVRINDYSGGPDRAANLEVYRLGYYGGAGGRLVTTITGRPLRNQGFLPPFDQFGYTTANGLWTENTLIPTDDLESGVYLIKIVGTFSGPNANHIPFVVRDDTRARDLLVVMPTNTWQAYNSFFGKCLYVAPSYDSSVETIAGKASDPDGAGGIPEGQSRAVKVSFDRPYANTIDDLNWVLRTEFPLIYWLERQGYDVTYTEDTALDAAGLDQLTAPMTKAIGIAGHSEYWTKGMFDNVAAARDAGTHIASFSANTSYWRVRYEDQRRTLVCFKTTQGIGSDAPDDGRDGVNDFGPLDPDGAGPGSTGRGGPFDPLGPNGRAGDDDDRPEYATTTFRDPGAAPGTPSAPDGVGSAPQTAFTDRSFEGLGRVGINRPENSLWGVLFVGGDSEVSYPLQVPAGDGDGGEFGAHPAWRHTKLANLEGRSIGSNLVGWEWDAIPRGNPGDPAHVYARYLARQPVGVRRLTHTDVNALRDRVPPADRAGLIFLLDEGRRYSSSSLDTPATPPAGQGSAVNAVTYRGRSGAYVFAAGTIQWSFGLGPHFDANGERTYESPRVDDTVQPVIQQATCNILADMGVKPATPQRVVLDP